MIQGEPKITWVGKIEDNQAEKKLNYSVSKLIRTMYWFLELALVNLNIVIQITERNEQKDQLITW